MDIANLNLVSFIDAATDIEAALKSDDPLHRYWGLIVCSSHGMAAMPFVDHAKTLAARDDNGLVRVRAAEFLGLIGAQNPQANVTDALKNSTSGIEAGLMLNSVTLLRDGKPGYDFTIKPDLLSPEVRKNDTVKRRLEYLTK